MRASGSDGQTKRAGDESPTRSAPGTTASVVEPLEARTLRRDALTRVTTTHRHHLLYPVRLVGVDVRLATVHCLQLLKASRLRRLWQ